MMNWRGAKPRKDEVVIAKNYLQEPELAALNNLVEQYLLFAEAQAMRRVPMHMKDWIVKLNGFLTLNDRAILDTAGTVSHELAKEFAEKEYDAYYNKSINTPSKADADFDAFATTATKLVGQRKKRNRRA